MDLTFSPAEEAFRAECRAWLEANVPRPALPSGDTRAGFTAHLAWERALFDARYAVVSWPERVRRPRREPLGVADLRRGVLPRRRARSASRRTASSCWRRRSSSSARPNNRTASWRRWRRANRRGARAGRNRTPAATSPAFRARPCATTRRAAGASSGQKTWTTRGAFCTHLFGLFRSDPDAERHHGLTYFLVDLATPGVTVRGVERLDGDEGFAEVFFDDVFVADADVLGEPNEGWAVAMATTGSERGLTLRSPGRFLATAQRLIDLYHECGDDDPVLRDRLLAAYIDAEAYRWQTFWTVTRLVEGVRAGAESSMVKVFWSELDVRLHETRARTARDHDAELARRRHRRVDEGLRVRARGSDLRGHERDPAQRDRGTRARTAEALTCDSRSPTTNSRSATRSARFSTRNAPPRTCATRGRTRPVASPVCGTSSSTWVWSACSHPKPTAGSGSRWSTSC